MNKTLLFALIITIFMFFFFLYTHLCFIGLAFRNNSFCIFNGAWSYVAPFIFFIFAYMIEHLFKAKGPFTVLTLGIAVGIGIFYSSITLLGSTAAYVIFEPSVLVGITTGAFYISSNTLVVSKEEKKKTYAIFIAIVATLLILVYLS